MARPNEKQGLLRPDEFQAGGGGYSNVRLVDHPDYQAPKLTSTWCSMLPRMLCGLVILIVIVGAMVSVVWSVVSSAPGDPLHQKNGALHQATLNATMKNKPEEHGKESSPFDWIKGVVNSRPNQ